MTPEIIVWMILLTVGFLSGFITGILITIGWKGWGEK